MDPVRRLYYRAIGSLVNMPWWNAYYRRLYRRDPERAYRGPGETPVVLLTTLGRRTGERRSTPVAGWPEQQNVILVAARAGSPRHPAWYLNLKAHPVVEVAQGRRVRRMHAREVTGAERERLWSTLVRGFAGYDAYRAMTRRRIPVVVLEPISDPALASSGQVLTAARDGSEAKRNGDQTSLTRR